MSHHVYNTRGLVLVSRGVREADKVFSLLTRDLGFVVATAQGIRKGNSKLGGILLDLALVDVSLIRGKSAWRITTAALMKNYASVLEKSQTRALAQVMALVEKLVHGEEKHADLFDDMVADVGLLQLGIDPEIWEIFAVSHLLAHLGYLTKDEVPHTLESVKENKKRIVSLVNQGIRESGL